jgi:diguanylate cyclase (GGDEF)-like protein
LYGARANAAKSLEALASTAADAVLDRPDGRPGGGDSARPWQRLTGASLDTELWDVFPGRVGLLDCGGVLVSVNRAWRCYGAGPGAGPTAEVGENYLQVCRRAARSGAPEAAEAADLIRAALAGLAMDRRVCYRGRDGRWFGVQALPLAGPGGGALVLHLDITAERRREHAWRHQARHDPLTGLPNRALLLDRLDHAIAGAARDPGSLAVLFVDLDAFKAVNDRHGHAAGDQVLRAAAQRMADSVRSGDTIGRWGGDEFLVVSERLRHSTAAADRAEWLRRSLREPIDVAGGPLSVDASVGVAHFEAGQTREDLVNAADRALQELRRGRPVRRLAGRS